MKAITLYNGNAYRLPEFGPYPLDGINGLECAGITSGQQGPAICVGTIDEGDWYDVDFDRIETDERIECEIIRDGLQTMQELLDAHERWVKGENERLAALGRQVVDSVGASPNGIWTLDFVREMIDDHGLTPVK